MSNNRRSTSKRKPIGKVFIITFLIALVVFTSGMGLGNYILNRPVTSNEDPRTVDIERAMTEENLQLLISGEGIFAKEFKNSKRVNVLLLGNTDEGLSDTIMLLSFDPDTKRGDIISVPRDTYYPRKGKEYGGYLKINSAFHDGPMETAEAVHNVLLGIPINYYAVIDYTGIEKIVDSMNGVPMDVPMDMKYYVPEQNLNIDLKAGNQVLDGDHAVQFLRFRHTYANGDLGRIEAQQQFMKSAAKRALGLNLIKVSQTVRENVISDLTVNAAIYLAGKVQGMDSSSIYPHMLPGEPGGVENSNLSFFVRYDDSKIEDMLYEIYDPNYVKPDESETGGKSASK